jgi:hypothetical protein
VRNVEQSRKEGVNRKNVRNALKQGPCKNRKKKNLPAAVAPVKNNFFLKKPLPSFLCRGLFLFSSKLLPYPKTPSKCFQIAPLYHKVDNGPVFKKYTGSNHLTSADFPYTFLVL